MQTPEYYRKLIDMASFAGLLMISSGAETHRVEDTIQRILSTTSFQNQEAMVFPTGLIVTLSDPESESFSVTRRVAGVSNNLGRVADVNQVSREFCSGKITLEEAVQKLKAIQNYRRYSDLVRILGYVLASSAFCVMFGGELLDAVGTIFCGFALAFVNVILGPKIGKGFITNILAGAALTVTAGAVAFYAKAWFGISFQAHYMIIGSVMPLVPGLAMTNAARDILHGDYLSGGSRAIEAFCIAAVVSVGVGAGMGIVNLCGFAESLVLNFNLYVDNFGRFMLAITSSGVAICGLYFLFDIQPNRMLFCGLSAALSWAVYLIANLLKMSDIWGSFFATLAVGLFSHICARTLKTPVITFLVAGILPLVPGISIYKAVYAIMFGEPGAGQTMLGAILTVGVIALAIFLIDSLVDVEKNIRTYIRSLKKQKKN